MRAIMLLAAALVAGCSHIDSDEGKFVINERTRTEARSDYLLKLRQAWKADTASMTQRSKAVPIDVRWTLDFIANIEAGGVKPCSALELLAVNQLDPQWFTVRNSRMEVVRFTPRSYHEEWVVKACDEIHLWRVFEETSDRQSPLRVLLWSTKPAR